jgi:hypothetical protein
VGWKMLQLGIAGLMRAGRRQDGDGSAACSLSQPREVGNDFGRSRYVEGTTRFHEISLGIHVKEYQRALEHGLATSRLFREFLVPAAGRHL